MKLERTAKVNGGKVARIWIEERKNEPVIHVQYETLHKVYMFTEKDNALIVFLAAGQPGNAKELIIDNIDHFIINNEPSEGRMEIIMQLN